jgi:hypothetical protein
MYHQTENMGVVGFRRVVLEGRFFPNAGSAVSNASNKGKGWTVVRTSQGLFTLTLNYYYPQIDSVVCTLQLASAAARWVQVGTITTASKTIEIRVVDAAGAVQDVGADANNSIGFEICTRCSSAELQ